MAIFMEVTYSLLGPSASYGEDIDLAELRVGGEKNA